MTTMEAVLIEAGIIEPTTPIERETMRCKNCKHRRNKKGYCPKMKKHVRKQEKICMRFKEKALEK